MTILVYRDGFMAADSGSWMGDALVPWANKLAFRTADQSLHALAGNAAQAEAYLEWVRGDREEMPRPEREDKGASTFVALIVRQERPNDVRLLTAYGEEVYRDVPYFAYGASSQAAFAALWMGATAVEAIWASIAHGCNAERPVRFLRGFGGASGISREPPVSRGRASGE